MTMEKLIEKMRDELDNGVYAVVQDSLEKCRNGNERDYDFLSGIVWGLYSTNFISKDDRVILGKELIDIIDLALTKA